MGYELSKYAREDLIEIWNYTLDRWGSEQAERYLSSIFDSFGKIADEKFLYKELIIDNEIVKFIRCGHHYIFFLPDNGSVIILRVLHEKMDFVAALQKRLLL